MVGAMPLTTLVELYREAFRAHPKPDAFRFKQHGAWQDLSSAEAQRGIERIAAALEARGIQQGDRVAILSENRLEWALADFGILTAGGATVPIYATLTAGQARHILADSESKLAIVSTRAQLAKVSSVESELPKLEGVIVLDADATDPMSWAALLAEGDAALAKDPARGSRLGDGVRPEDVATLIYTSGTTGVPKGVILTHANLVSNVTDALRDFTIGPEDTALSVLPLSHIFERMAGHYTMVCRAVTVAYAESVDTLSADMQAIHPTIVLAVPRLFERIYGRVVDAAVAGGPIKAAIFRRARAVALAWTRHKVERTAIPPLLALQHGLFDRLVYRTLRERTGGRIRFFVSGGAPLQREIAAFFMGAGLPVLEGYGLTETSPVIAVNRPNDNIPGTVGPPIANVTLRIADDGEILVQSPGVMRGYFRLPAETEAALEGGWFHTGDIGHLDARGHLVITDRKKDLLVTAGGKKVAPQPIENALKTSPYVAEAVLIGDQRPFVSALIVPNFAQLEAYAKLKGISFVTHSDLVKHPDVHALFEREIMALTKDLARFEMVKRFALLDHEFSQDQGELTPTLKVRRKIVLAKYAREIDALYAGHETPDLGDDARQKRRA
jgi:long-chain acyl-CoA synthetase